MKKIIILIMILLLSGCYDYVEIEDTLIVTGIIIDYIDDNYNLTTEVIDNNTTKIFKTKGKSIDECLYKISNSSNKDIFISHLKTIFLTKNTINNNQDYIDYFLRNTKSKMNYYIFYVEDKYKDKIFDINKEGTSTYLNDLIELNNKIYSTSTPLSFLDLVYKKYNRIDIMYPNVIIKDNNLYLENLIAFKDDKELIINNNQTIFYNMLTNSLEKTILNIPCDDNYYSLTINNNKTKYYLDKDTLELKTTLKGKIINYNCKLKLDDKDTIKKLSDLTQEYLNNNIKELIDISTTTNIDFLAIQNYIYKHDYKNYKKYNLNNIKIKTKSKVIIDSIGEMNK